MLGEEKSILSRSAASIEHRAGDLLHSLDKNWLRFTNVPRSLAVVGLLKAVFCRCVVWHQVSPFLLTLYALAALARIGDDKDLKDSPANDGPSLEQLLEGGMLGSGLCSAAVAKGYPTSSNR